MSEKNKPIDMPRFFRPAGGGPGQRFRPTERPKDTKKTLQKLLKIFMLQKRVFIFAICMTIISSLATLSIPYLIGRAIDSFDPELTIIKQDMFSIALFAMLGAYITGWLIETQVGILMAKASQKLIRHMRKEFFSKLQRLPLNFYDTTPHGDTMSRLTNDIDNISGSIAQTTTQFAHSILSFVGTFIMMCLLSLHLTLVALITIPLVFLLTKIIAKRSRFYFREQQKSLGQLNGLIEESIIGLKLVKAFNRQKIIGDDFEEINIRLEKYSIKANMWSGFLMPFLNVINNLTFGLVAVGGSLLTVRGVIGIGVVVSFLSYSRQFVQPLNNIAGMFNSIQSALAGAERVFEIFDQQEEVSDKADCFDLVDPKGAVEFRDVHFSYDGGRTMALRNISFKVEPGEVVAFVGETGAGKTTIVNLLTRFYELDRGKILIDGKDITNISRKSLRSCFSVVLQDTCLFSGTIASNIRYGNPDATDQQLQHAAKLANSDGFIERLPQKYQTIVTGSGESLSQGQRQLLAITRAALCDAPILILDEATSSVDTRTEKNIQTAMIRLMKNRTCFIIAHRLSTIKDADRIMVLHQGEIIESGTHKELMALKGQYWKSVNLGTVQK